MSLQPAIIEFGTGIDLHGQNATEAARRGVWNAIHQSSLMFLGLFGPDTSKNMIVEVTIATTRPKEINEQILLDELPHGNGIINIVDGGLEIEGRKGSGDYSLVVNAAIIVKIDLAD